MPKGCSNPGHGGRDSGAVGKRSLEKDINLQVSLKFAKRMRELGFEMSETRTADAFVSLSEIAAIANRSVSDFFQSNHCNAGGGRGFEIYALPGGKAEQWARIMEKHLAAALGLVDRGVKTNQNYYVLVHTNMPAILVELAFIDNPGEEELLLNLAWQEKAVEAMAQAWCEVFSVTYQPPRPVEPSPTTNGQNRDELVKQALQCLDKLREVVEKLR
ncbi:MAG TPA: N-acetylmuramoyl-L-alanine amidase [Verrucomicrobiae bacterium]|nr:N-acetylmuramoyl-L-alanine amidase [Verrucomicrobiae bacterium]